jgi:oxaloacetate decarboxylase gamma subunit
MTIFEMLEQSGILTLLGMGIVFTFLVTLIVIIYQVGKLFNSKDSDNNTTGSSVKAGETNAGFAAAAPASAGNSARITAAISAAVAEYRKEY